MDHSASAGAGLAGLPEDEADAIRWGHAAALIDWPAPPSARPGGPR